MQRHAALRQLLSAVLILILTALLASGCSEPQEQPASEPEGLEQCRSETLALQKRLEELQQQAAEPQPPAPPAAEVQALTQRVEQLEYTLNRAYIDMKAALLERETCQKRADAMQRENDALRRKVGELSAGQ